MMRSNQFQKFSLTSNLVVTIYIVLLLSSGLSLAASSGSMDVSEGSAAVLKTSPMMKRAELIQTVPAVGSMELLNRETAARLVQDAVVTPLWERADQSKGLRVVQHSEMVAKGAVIEPAVTPLGEAKRRMVAQNQSWLFMIDEMPGAHFAHPVKLVLMDAATGEKQEMKTDWWPKVNDVQLFETERKRTDPKVTIFYREPIAEVRLSTSSGVLGQLGNIKPLIKCDVWAVLVCGYNDLPDSFDEDTNGMYAVLRTLGVPDDRIFYLSPHAGHTGVDRQTSRTNVQWAINEVAARSDAKDKVLFLYSSHGNVNFVSCVPDIPDGGIITANEMDNWLDAISCKEMAIIIEACHSGSFIGKYKDGTYVFAENELTGDGETNRIVFTSASSDTSSWPDIDGDSDPNPADTGSESIYGYIMAFGIASADSNGDGRISFGEAHQYAWNNDVTRILGWNVPQLIESGLNKANVYHQCLQYECYSNLPSPELTLAGTEDYTAGGGEYTRYLLSVTNWNAYPGELFESAPDLPPCGLNTESSRMWVDIYDASGKRLYGFCALSSPSDLQNLWFAVKKGETPPKSVFVVLKDRRCNEDFTSNQVTIGPKIMVMAPMNMTAVQIKEPMRVVGKVLL